MLGCAAKQQPITHMKGAGTGVFIKTTATPHFIGYYIIRDHGRAHSAGDEGL